MTVTPVVFITEHVDHAAITEDRLPRLTSLLQCATCGHTRGRHQPSRGACEHFTRPTLPDSYAYLDEITPETIIQLSGPGHTAPERVISVHDRSDASLPAQAWLATRPLLRLVTSDLHTGQQITRFISPESIITIW